MDKNEGDGDGSSKKPFDLNKYSKEENVDDNFPLSARVNEELGLRMRNEQEIKRKNSYEVPAIQPELAVNDVTDGVEQNPNIVFGVSEIGSSSHQRNVLGQGVDGTRPVLNSASSSQRNVLGQSINGTNTNDVARHQLQSPRGVQMRDSTYRGYSHAPRPHPNQILSPNQFLRAMSIPPFFIPRGVHEHNMRIQLRPDPFSGYVIPPLAQMVPPMVRMVPPMVRMVPPTVAVPPPMVRMVPPTVAVPPLMVQMAPPIVAVPPPVVQMVPPMVEMRPPMDHQRGFLHDPTRPSSNINTGVRSGTGRIREASYGDEASSQDRRQRDDDQGLTSRDAKRSKSSFQ